MVSSDHHPINQQEFSLLLKHKNERLSDINKQNLKMRLISDQTGTCFYNLVKFLAKYSQPIVTNQYTIANTQTFPSKIDKLSLLHPDEKEVSCHIESLFTNVTVKETIKYITKAVNEKEKLSCFCFRQIFSKLLLRATTKSLFTTNGLLHKQIDGGDRY